MQNYYIGTDGYRPVKYADLADECTSFPIVGLLKEDYTDAGTDTFSNAEPDWFAKLNELYTQQNIEAWKGILLYQFMEGTLLYLDQDCLDLYDEYQHSVYGTGKVSDPAEDAYDYCSSSLSWAIGKIYCDAYITEKDKQAVTDMIGGAVSFYQLRT